MTSVVLIGPRCAGKTSVGRALADDPLLALTLVDLDEEVLARLGATSAVDVFATRGEVAWREAESAVLVEALQLAGDRNLVIATGGGVVCDEANRGALSRAVGRGDIEVVWLHVSPALSQARLAREVGDRPPLSPTGDAVAEAQAVAQAREALYGAVAGHQVDADGDMGAVVAAVRAVLGGAT